MCVAAVRVFDNILPLYRSLNRKKSLQIKPISKSVFTENALLITMINLDPNSKLSQIRPLLIADTFPARGGRKFAEVL
jgi:hypothetical protein